MSKLHGFTCLLILGIVNGCGGAEPQPETSATVMPPTPTPEAEPAPEPETEPEAQAEPEPAPEPPMPPLTAENAEQVQAAVFEAATDVVALRRLIDADFGVGVYAPGDEVIQHYCDMENLASHAGLGFLVNVSDEFRCNADLSRCSVRDRDGRGFAFHFRGGGGAPLYLNAVVHYERRVPNSDSSAIMEFVNGGDGVCAIERNLARATVSERLSVFVSEFTGQAEETVIEHHCEDAVAGAFAERVQPLSSSPPSRCTRAPARCVYTTQETETTIYGNEGAIRAVAITRPGMQRNLARAQDQQLASFVMRLRSNRCD